MMTMLVRTLFALLALAALSACEPALIPNTRIEDSGQNREVVEFIEKYRTAIEARNSNALLALASVNYFDDMGTPAGNDDIDYDGLKVDLEPSMHTARLLLTYKFGHRD